MEVVSTTGLTTSTRTDGTALTEDGSRFIQFGDEDNGDVIKVITLMNANDNATNPQILDEITPDEMNEETVVSWPPTKWAQYRQGPGFVTLKLNAEATEDDYEFIAEVEENTAELSGDDEPQFARPFHDILIHGVMAIEADKKEKSTRQNRFEIKFEKRLSELRYHIATTQHRRFWQGRRPRGRR